MTTLISSILFLVANLVLAFFILLKNRRSTVNIIFSILVIAVCIWIFSNLAIDYIANDSETLLFWSKFALIGPSIIPCAFLFFTLNFPKRKIAHALRYYFYLAPVLILFFLIPTDLNIVAVTFTESDLPEVVPGPLYIIFGAYFFIYMGLAFRNLWKSYRENSGIYKLQIRYVALGMLLTALFALITNLVFPILGYSQIGVYAPYTTFFFIFCTAYAVIKYRLMDIRLIVTRSLVYAILVSLITGTFVLVTFLSSYYLTQDSRLSQIGIAIVSSLLIVLLLDPIKRSLARVTNKVFFKQAINYPEVTKKITDIINEEIELGSLVNRFCSTTEDELRIKHVSLLLPVSEDVYIVPEERVDTKGKAQKPLTVRRSSALGRELYRNRGVIILDELDRKVADAQNEVERERFDEMRQELENLDGYAAVPVAYKDSLIAIIVLSRKLSGEMFSLEDIQFLQVIAPQMASAIQKAKLYQEEKEFGIKLQREVEKATADLKVANAKLTELDKAKSEFMSIASHQLRTPLAGIMGYLSMVIQGDYGNMTKEQEPILRSVLDATQRLIRMVNLFLNVTRIEAGRFVMNYTKKPFNEIVNAVYMELKPTADKKDVKLIYKDKKLPEVEVDEDKIKDVMLNLIDNAIKYSPAGAVTVTAEANKRNVHFKVKDTGVGIPVVEVKNLFDKFVRGSGIAQVDPNGSGLGLFIARKITEGHGGRIWAESEGEGKGSTFNFEVPIKADTDAKKKTEDFKKQAKKKK